MKRSQISTIALIVCLVLLAAGAWMMFGQSTGIANADKYTAGDTEINDPVENLDVDWTAGEVVVEYHAGSGVKITESSTKEIAEDRKMQWWLDGTTLRIRYEKQAIRLFSNDPGKTLTISLPEGIELKTADIRLTSGEMRIPELTADEALLGCTSGRVDAAVKARTLKCEGTSGDLIIRQTGDSDSVTISSTSGTVTADLENAKTIEAGTTSGKVTLTVSGSADSIRAHSTSGDVIADANEVKKADLSSTSGSITFSAGAFEELKAGSTSGGITVRLPAEPGFTVEASTTSGSFNSDIAMGKEGNRYTCGDGSAKCVLSATSGDIRVEERK